MHRGLKLDSILVHKDYNGIITVKLGDLGEARDMSATVRFDTIDGTEYFMAPEMGPNTLYTFKADIFSLGVLMFELLENKIPVGNKKDYANCEMSIGGMDGMLT